MSLTRLFFSSAFLMASVSFAGLAQADGDKRMTPLSPQYKQECASCHTPYPPGMMPANSWKRLMGGLSKHYGTDASLDAKDLQDISAWLQAHAGTYKRVSEEPPQDRITLTAWFTRKHNSREVAPEVWKRASVGSASNCVACHANAAQGNFNERDIRIPR
jgi:mono/diheme cytochrome c family protein